MDASSAVGIYEFDDEDGWINVKWDKGRKKKHGPAFFPAKVLMLSGK